MTSDKVPVLIVGAGPTGLMMACQLSRHHIPFRIIDKNPGPSERSKALALQSRTLEIYDQMGIAARALAEGHINRGVNFIVKGEKIQRIPLDDAGRNLSQFPFMHILEQNKNEILLNDYLSEKNISVEWNTELISLKQDEKGVLSKVIRNGVSQEIESSWLVGADGGSSVVRHQLGISFPGDTYENIFYVADTAVEWNIGYNELFLYVSNSSFTGFFPMKGEKRFRIVGILPKQFQHISEIQFSDIEETIRSTFETKISFSSTNWFSVYRLHHRSVENFRLNRCFLAGDAAHIHSPAGGQGMNTGLQDAYNLAWKMAYVEKKIAGEKILESYNEERLPFAKKLVKTTDRAFGFIISQNPVLRWIRLNLMRIVIPLLFRFDFVRIFAYKTISQISINYSKSKICINERSNSLRIKAGDRFPYYLKWSSEANNRVSVYDEFKEPFFYILFFMRKVENRKIQQLEKLKLKHPFLKIKLIFYEEHNMEAFSIFQVKKRLVCIVRPDNYIGYLSTDLRIEKLKNFFLRNEIEL